jgi:hypothetical protein
MEGIVMKARRAIALTVAGLAIFAGAAAASPIKWVAVDLGAHRFGQLRAPDQIVAHAGPGQVGFKKQGQGCGCSDGPQGPMLFDIAPNGSVWMLDILNDRLLVWQAGHPARPARTVPLKGLDVRDFALGKDGTVYLYAVYAKPPAGDSGANLWALRPSGQLLWRAHALMLDALRVGPGGVLYSVGVGVGNRNRWTPLTNAAGRPLSIASQRRGTTSSQPLAGGLHLVATQVGVHEVHFAVVDRAHKVLRAWRISSRTHVTLAGRVLTPKLTGNDLIVQVDVSRQSAGKVLWEHEVVRLTPEGARAPFAVDAKAVYGDDGVMPITALRVASDGRLYQLRTSPNAGASVARYALR